MADSDLDILRAENARLEAERTTLVAEFNREVEAAIDRRLGPPAGRPLPAAETMRRGFEQSAADRARLSAAVDAELAADQAQEDES